MSKLSSITSKSGFLIILIMKNPNCFDVIKLGQIIELYLIINRKKIHFYAVGQFIMSFYQVYRD